MPKKLQKVMIFYVIVKRLLTDEENVVNVGNFFQGLPPDLLLLDTHDPLDDEEADHDHSNDDNQAHVGEILLNEC